MVLRVGIVGSAANFTNEDVDVVRSLANEILDLEGVDLFICFDDSSLPVEVGKEVFPFKKVSCFTCNFEESEKATILGFNAINLNLPRMNREIEFIKNVDVLVVCGGGSGTLMEVTFAYQMGKKIFLLEGVQGSVEPFREKFLDLRKRVKVESFRLGDLKKIISI